MAISLNDHESRIEALENLNLSSSVTKLYTNPKVDDCDFDGNGKEFSTVLPDISEYSFLAILMTLGTERSMPYYDASRLTLVYPVKMLQSEWCHYNDYYGLFNQTYRTDAVLIGLYGNKFSVKGKTGYSVTHTPTGCIESIWGIKLGLKLYYNFSYNIIAKIILRIISKISHFFTKIFKYGGESKDGYIC